MQYQSVAGRCCNGKCVDLTQDSANCSACGTSCSSGLCVAGSPWGGFGGSMCYAPATSNCSVSCPSDMFCTSGGCRPKTCQGGGLPGGSCLAGSGAAGMCCPQGFTSTCVNPTNDPQNCGGCGISCGTGTCNNGVCSNIAAPCSAGHLGQFCNLDAGTSHVCCPGGGCIDTSDDEKNCGRCGNACGNGLTCVAGACVALSCTSVTQNQQCPYDGGAGGNCCSNNCVDRKTDVANCGACGRLCAGSETCASGLCGLDVCTAGDLGAICHRSTITGISSGTCCTAGCVDTRYDKNNCGSCGRVCPGDAGCVAGNCM
jgi:hypothetical protein